MSAEGLRIFHRTITSQNKIYAALPGYGLEYAKITVVIHCALRAFANIIQHALNLFSVIFIIRPK